MATLRDDLRILDQLVKKDRALTTRTTDFYKNLNKTDSGINIQSSNLTVNSAPIAPRKTSVLDSLKGPSQSDLEAGRVESAIGNVVKGVGSIISSVPKSFGETGRIVESKFANSEQEANAAIQNQNFFDELGKSVDEFFDDITDINPAYQEETSQKIARGLGSALGIVAGGLAGSLAKAPVWLLPAVLGGTSSGVEQVEDYKNTIKLQGGIVNANDQANAFTLGATLGAITEPLPITRALGRLDKVSGGIVAKIIKGTSKNTVGKVLGEGFTGGLEELTQEAIQQAGSNYIANGLVEYDPERGTFKDIGEAATVGGGVGFILNTLLASIGAKRVGRLENAEFQAQAKDDLKGLGGSEDTVERVSKQFKKNALNPETDQPFQNKQAERTLRAYLALHGFRKNQESIEGPVDKVQKRLDETILNLENSLVPEEGKTIDPILRQESEDVLNFINSVEGKRALAKQEELDTQTTQQQLEELSKDESNISEQITIKGLSNKRISALNKDQKAQIEALNQRIAQNAKERGFDINRTAEDITIGPVDFSNNSEKGLFEGETGPVEEIQIHEPITQQLLDNGVSLEDIQLGNIPLEPIIEEELVDISPERVQELNGERNSLIDRVRASNELDTTIASLYPNLKEELTDAIRNDAFDQLQERFDFVKQSQIEETFNLKEIENRKEEEVSQKNRKNELAKGRRVLEKVSNVIQPKEIKDLLKKVRGSKILPPQLKKQVVTAINANNFSRINFDSLTEEQAAEVDKLSFENDQLSQESLPDVNQPESTGVDFNFQRLQEFIDLTRSRAEDIVSSKEEKEDLKEVNQRIERVQKDATRVDTEKKNKERREKEEASGTKIDKPEPVAEPTIKKEPIKKSPRTKATKKSSVSKTKTPEVKQVAQADIDYALDLKEQIDNGNTKAELLIKPKFGGKRAFNKFVKEIKNGTIVAGNVKSTLTPDQEQTAKAQIQEKQDDEQVARFLANTTSKDLIDNYGFKTTYRNEAAAKLAIKRKGLEELYSVKYNEQFNNYYIDTIEKPSVIEPGDASQNKRAKVSEKTEESLEVPIEIQQRLSDLELQETQLGIELDFATSPSQIDIITEKLDSIQRERLALEEGYQKPLAESIREVDGDQLIDLEDGSTQYGKEQVINIKGQSFTRDTGPIKLDIIQVQDKTTQDIERERAEVEGYSSAIKDNLAIHYIGSFTELDPIRDSRAIKHIEKIRYSPAGLYFESDTFGNPVAYIFGNVSPNSVQTMLHEIVGHHGMRGLLGKDWDNFLSKVYTNDNNLANKIFQEISPRWENLINKDKELKSGKVKVKNTNGQTVILSNEAMKAMTDEYIAELAKKFSDPTFTVPAKEQGFIKRIIAVFKHFLKKVGLGKYSQRVTENDILQLLSQSKTRLFDDNILQQSFTKNQGYESKLRQLGIRKDSKTEIKNPIPYSNTMSSEELQSLFPGEKVYGFDTLPLIDVEVIEEAPVSFQEDPGDIVRAMGAPDSNIAEVERLRRSNFASTNTSSYQKFWTNLGQNLENNKIVSKLSPLGSLPAQREYSRQSGILLSNIQELGEKFPARLHEEFSKLNDIQNEQVFDFMTTQGADVNELDVSPTMKKTIREVKDIIRQMGENFTKFGLLSEKTFEENKDSYLPRIYLKYLSEGKGFGKKQSFQNYLKQQKQLPEDIRRLLDTRRIKDVSILIPDTVATLGRDQAVLHFFDNINQAGKELGVDWSLRDEFKINVNGRNWYIPDAEDEIQNLRDILVETKGMSEAEVQANRNQLKQLEDAVEQGKDNAQASLEAKAKAAGFDTWNSFRDTNYRQLPNTKRYGPLRNAFIRKEIYDDLNEVVEIFIDNPKNSGIFDKLFGPRGALVKAHNEWKRSKVPFNVPSWFRNFGGNMALLDISSNRNSVTLTKWVAEEFNNVMISGNGSKWSKLAEEGGLYGTTLAEQELLPIRRGYQEKIRVMQREERGEIGAIENLFTPLKDKYIALAELTSGKYGLLEGVFKAVRLRDHITEWEDQTGRKFDSYDSIINNPKSSQEEVEKAKAERAAVLDEGIFQANQAVFDYSKVPNFLRQLRRYPLGTPFVTFTYKAFPQVLRSFARRPQKFLKYAALPFIAQQAFLYANPDLDEEDYKELERSLPLAMREKSSVYVTPFKDANGKFDYIPFGYYLPWAPFTDYAYHLHNNLDGDTTAGMLDSTYDNIMEGLDTFGFLGGPVPQLISAFKNGIDSFTGRPIVDPGASPTHKWNQRLTYAWGMAMPSWLTNYGFLGKALDNSGINILPGSHNTNLDNLGRDKETGFQVATRLFGLNVTPIDVEKNRRNTRIKFEKELQEVSISRNKLLRTKGLNSQDKAAELRQLNEQAKRIRAKMQEALQ